MREEFEKLRRVKNILDDYSGDIVFNNEKNEYETPCYKNWTPEYIYELNFGWYAYQEQQKKIDAVLNAIYQSELYGDRAIWGIQDEIKELLK